MVARMRRVVTGAAKARDARLAQSIVEPANAGDIDRHRVEDLLAARDRLAGRDRLIAAGEIGPGVVFSENYRAERRAGRVVPERIVDADEEIRQILSEVGGPPGSALPVERTCDGVDELCGEQAAARRDGGARVGIVRARAACAR